MERRLPETGRLTARFQLVALYAALVAVGYLVHALPGEPYYRSNSEYAFWMAIDVLLIVLIARGSRVAIAIPLVLNVLGVLAILVFAVVPLPPGVVAFLFVKAAEIAVLVLLWRRPSVASPGRAAFDR